MRSLSDPSLHVVLITSIFTSYNLLTCYTPFPLRHQAKEPEIEIDLSNSLLRLRKLFSFSYSRIVQHNFGIPHLPVSNTILNLRYDESISITYRKYSLSRTLEKFNLFVPRSGIWILNFEHTVLCVCLLSHACFFFPFSLP